MSCRFFFVVTLRYMQPIYFQFEKTLPQSNGAATSLCAILPLHDRERDIDYSLHFQNNLVSRALSPPPYWSVKAKFWYRDRRDMWLHVSTPIRFEKVFFIRSLIWRPLISLIRSLGKIITLESDTKLWTSTHSHPACRKTCHKATLFIFTRLRFQCWRHSVRIWRTSKQGIKVNIALVKAPSPPRPLLNRLCWNVALRKNRIILKVFLS